MIDTNTIWEEAQKEARAEVIAKHRVVALRNDVTQEQRVKADLQGLARAAASLHMHREDIRDGDEILELLDEAETHIMALNATLRARRNMRESMARLAGIFGKGAP